MKYPTTPQELVVWKLNLEPSTLEYAFDLARNHEDSLVSIQESFDWIHQLVHCPDTKHTVTWERVHHVHTTASHKPGSSMTILVAGVPVLVVDLKQLMELIGNPEPPTQRIVVAK